MSLADLYASGKHKTNLGHFANIAHLAAIDGEISTEEDTLLHKMARKLGVSDTEFNEVVAEHKKFPINPPASKTERLERLYDFFIIIYSDNKCDEEELELLKRYATGLGFTSEQGADVIAKSIRIFEGKIGFENYQHLLDKI